MRSLRRGRGEGEHSRRWSHTEALAEVRARGNGFVWIGLFEPDDAQINVVAADYGLHRPAVQDAVCAHGRPKLDHYGDTVFVVLKTLRMSLLLVVCLGLHRVFKRNGWL